MKTQISDFGKEVKKKLIDRDMTQVELAAMVGCDKYYLYKILHGKRSGEKYIGEISKILDISIGD